MGKLKVPKLFKNIRHSLAAVNVVFLTTGLLLLFVGIIVLVNHSEYDALITNKFITLPGFAIGTGIIILLTAVIGFYGAISEMFYVIAGYVILLIVVLIFEIAITILGFNLQDRAASEIRSSMAQSMQLYESRIEIAKTWDDLQMGFECCGVTGRHDWVSNRIPVSCCHIDYGTVSPFQCTAENAYATGCASALGEWLSYTASIIAITALICTCLQVLIVLAAAYLAWRSKFEEVVLES